MAKAMLIMDMPSCCKECPCVDELGYIRVCHCTGEVIESGYAVRRQDNCPLREVKEGEWIFKYEGTYNSRRAYCSVCGNRNGIGGIKENQKKPYCPNCGAKMKVDEILGGGE
jgi:hypothetical protein